MRPQIMIVEDDLKLAMRNLALNAVRHARGEVEIALLRSGQGGIEVQGGR